MRLYCVKLDATLAFPNCKLNLVALRSVIEHRAPKSRLLTRLGRAAATGAAGRVSTAPRTPGYGGGEGGRDPAPSRGGGASLHRPPSRSFWGDGASFHRAPYPWLRRRRRRGVEIPSLLGRRGESPPPPYPWLRAAAARGVEIPSLLGRRGESPLATVPLATGGGGKGGRDPEPSGAAGRVSTDPCTPCLRRRRRGG
eukprot:tig00021741_g23290.t1